MVSQKNTNNKNSSSSSTKHESGSSRSRSNTNSEIVSNPSSKMYFKMLTLNLYISKTQDEMKKQLKYILNDFDKNLTELTETSNVDDYINIMEKYLGDNESGYIYFENTTTKKNISDKLSRIGKTKSDKLTSKLFRDEKNNFDLYLKGFHKKVESLVKEDQLIKDFYQFISDNKTIKVVTSPLLSGEEENNNMLQTLNDLQINSKIELIDPIFRIKTPLDIQTPIIMNTNPTIKEPKSPKHKSSIPKNPKKKVKTN